MPPQSFDRSKTDLKSLLRSGTWLYQCGQGAEPFSSSPNLSTPSFNFNDLYTDSDRDIHHDPDLNTDGRTLDQINFRDVDSTDFPLNTFNFEPPEPGDDRTVPDQEYPLENPWDQPLAVPLATREQSGPPKRASDRGGWLGTLGRGKWGGLLLVLGVLIPVGLFKGLSPLPLPQSASSLSTPLVPPIELEKATPVGPLEQAAQAADWATALIATAQTPADWQRIGNLWQEAITLLGRIPSIDPQYTLAQSRLISYRNQLDYATAQGQSLAMTTKVLAEQDQIFRVAVRAAIDAAELTQSARTPQEWQEVVNHWQAAIEGMSQISVQSPHYAIAQDRLSTYTQNLNYAQQRCSQLCSK